MVKNKIRTILLIVFVLILIILPNYCNAKNVNLDYKSISETSTLTIENLYFDSIDFTTSDVFGLEGIVKNNGDSGKNFIAKATFYDKDYNLLATLESNQYVPAYEKNAYSNVGNISKIKPGYTADDICYYFLSVYIKDVIQSTGTTPEPSHQNYDYVINDYKIDMVVNEDNTFDITETIAAYFNISKHGIFRKIPFKNSITRLDGTESNNKAQISNISVSEDYTTSNESGYKVIKIGDANKTLTGSHTYIIKYTYNVGKDPLKNADELYFNLIGNEWDTIIDNISFKITMPKSFDKSLLVFSSGAIGSTNSSNVEYSVIENTISGTVNNTLTPGKALTIRLSLPDKYFVGAGLKISQFSILIIIINIIFVFTAYVLWEKYGKDEKVVENVEFYPPDGCNSAEVGFLYEGTASNESIISLLIYLANKGYLKIEETEDKTLLSKKFRITKLKEYDGNNECEKIFFNGLFKDRTVEKLNKSKAKKIMKEAKLQGERISFQDALELTMEDGATKESVTRNDLYNSFYITLKRIRSRLHSKENGYKIFEATSIGKEKWLILMIIAIFVLITIKTILEYGESGLEILKYESIFPKIDFMELFKMVYEKTNYFGFICIAILGFFMYIMPKRTFYGNEMLGKIKGFKRFLETAEKSQLELLVHENPEYFYNILPYAYALGVSDVWINQFESISIQAPNWYYSNSGFSIHTFRTFMNDTMSSVQSVMSSSSSSGGCSSGGGSGGGGSW